MSDNALHGLFWAGVIALTLAIWGRLEHGSENVA
jgi:hypothetical protein